RPWQCIRNSRASCSRPVGCDSLAEALQTVVAAADGKIHFANPGIAETGASVVALRRQIDPVAGNHRLSVVKTQVRRLESSGQRYVAAGKDICAVISLNGG